jgi:hypothetical protein
MIGKTSKLICLFIIIKLQGIDVMHRSIFISTYGFLSNLHDLGSWKLTHD